MKELKQNIEKALKQVTWELNNVDKDNIRAINLIQGRINGYNHVLMMIERIWEQ